MRRVGPPFSRASFQTSTNGTLTSGIRRRLAAVIPALLLLLSIMPAAAARQLLHGHVPAAVTNLTPIGPSDPSTRLTIAIGLPLRNRDALATFLEQLYDPQSPNFHRYLTPDEFTQRFGPTVADYRAVTRFAQTHGLRVTNRHSNRLLLDVTGTIADIEKAFHLTLRVYQHPTESRTFYAPDTEPSLDLDTPVLTISGLDNFSPPRPNLKITPQNPGQFPNPAPGSNQTSAPFPGFPGGQTQPSLTGSGPLGFYLGYDFRAAYVSGVTLTGTGQSLGLLEFDGYYPQDIPSYEALAGLPNVTITNVLLDGFNGAPGQGNYEVALDIEMAISMAPGLSQVIVYEGTNPNDILNRMATDNLAKQLSSSWSWSGYGNLAMMEQIFQEFAAQGQSFFEASGDNGAYVGTIGNPVDDPYITIVSGTDLTTTGPRGAWRSETTWHDSGGGHSIVYPIPSWQQSINMQTNQGSTSFRNLPDVTLVGDNTWLIANGGGNFSASGTSIAAPLWAGLMALANQEAALNGEPPVGFINPALYALAKGPGYSALFHDITSGNNTNAGSPTLFSAVPGYDLCTGWGTPTSGNFLTALALPEPLRITPPPDVATSAFLMSGPVGGPFSPVSQTFSLTNISPAPFNWSVTSTSSWLTVSAGGGTLTPGGGATNVIASLTSTSSNLPAGTYTTTLRFTNLNDSFGQSRQFILGVQAVPVITSEPADQAVPAGGTAGFSVGIASNALLSFHWQLNGTNLTDNARVSGSTSNTLQVRGVSAADLGTYSVIVSNTLGSTNSSGAQLTIISSPPIITSQPATQNALPASTVTFTVTAIGDTPFNYQWQVNGTNLVRPNTQGINAQSCTLSNIQPADAGVYSVLVSNTVGWTSSTGAVLTINSVTAPGVNLVTMASFPGGTGSSTPYSPLVDGGGGQLYGTTLYGGNFHRGTVYRLITSSGNGPVTLFSFSGTGSVGSYPFAGLALGQDGNFYGTTYEGGTHTAGTLFKVTINGSITTLFSLNGNTGALPTAGMVQAKDSSFYGMTGSGGAYGFGTVFHRTASGVYTNLISFDFNDGAYPSAVLIQANDGFFYGTTENGGTNGFGTIFKMSPSGALTTLYSFSSGNDGGVPIPGLVQASDGNFYGTTSQGGSAANAGTIFRITPAGVLTTLHSFSGGSDGSVPWGGLMQSSDGNLYGTTQTGGTYGNGTVFRIAPNADPAVGLVTLVQFDGFDGAKPSAALIQASDGNLYGTTQVGGAKGVGTIFALNFNGPVQITGQPADLTIARGGTAVFTVATFGTGPFSYQWQQNGTNLVDDGRISGSTTATLQIANVTPQDANLYSVIVSNALGSATSDDAGLQVTVAPPIITAQPSSQTVLAGTLATLSVTAVGDQPLSYQWQANGTNLIDGPRISGSVSSILTISNAIATDAGSYSVIVSNSRNRLVSHPALLAVAPISPPGVSATNVFLFKDDVYGAFPYSALVQGFDGNLYGLASEGGSGYYGTFYRMTLSGVVSSLYSFTNGPDGAYPYSTPIQAANGYFYGATIRGGNSGIGGLFRLTSAPGSLRSVYSFLGGQDGAIPVAGVTLGADGNFYGTAYQGGSYNLGTLFRLTPAGGFTALYSFTGGVDGAFPYGGLVAGANGNLYGVALSGGAFGFGSVFKINTNGAFATVVSFSGDNGASPQAALVFGPDGNLYGSTSTSLTNGAGTLFRLTTDGRLTTLLWFNGTNGANPAGPLLVATDGNLYGTTSAGGPGGQGSVFQVTTNGLLRTLLWFGGQNGANPQAALIQATNGIFYGTAAQGGLGFNPTAGGGNGLIFQLTVPIFMQSPFTSASSIAAVPYSASIAGQAVYPAGDMVTFSKVSGPAWLSVAADGSLLGTPADADVGTNIFVVNLSDTNGFSASATMKLLVHPNLPPTFTVNPFAEPWANLDQSYSATIATNASDPDPNDTLVFSKVSGPAWLNIASNGALSGTPTGSNAGTNQFTVSVTDLDGLSATATMFVYVNSPPAFSPASFSKPAATINLAYSGSIAANATDPDLAAGDALTFYKVNGPAWLTVAPNGALSGTPATGDLGANSFLVLVTDSGGLAGIGSLAINVRTDSPPVFVSNPFTAPIAQSGLAYDTSIAASATDPDSGDRLTFAKVSGPSWLSVAGTGLLSGTPPGTDAGTNTFVVSVNDLAGLSNSATMYLNVAGPIRLTISPQGAGLRLSWTGGYPPYQVQTASNLPPSGWINLGAPISTNSILLSPTDAAAWFRIQAP